MTDELQQGTTPTLSEVLREYAQKATDSVNVSLPASLIAYDPATNSAQLQVSVKIADRDGETRSFPVLGGVPVIWPSGGGYQITWPLIVGDGMQVLFASNSIEDWLLSGNSEAEPSSKRRHSLSDAVCFPGGRPFVNPIVAISPTAMGIGSAATHIVIDDIAGLVKLGALAAVIPVALATANDANWTALAVWAGLVNTALNGLGAPVAPLPPPAATAATKVVAI